MTPVEYQFFCELLKKRSGLDLGPNKEYLLESRLMPLAKAAGLPGLSALAVRLRLGDEVLAASVTESMTTNETLFFRDFSPFEELRQTYIPALMEARRDCRKLRIWSAAASTGQEAYSLVMLLLESFPQLSSWSWEVLGTDLSRQALERAAAGNYSPFEIHRGLPPGYLEKYFRPAGGRWEVRQFLKSNVRFQPWNLLDRLDALGTFDLILCRNVLIYFDGDHKRGILDRVGRQLAPDGYLILGAAETIMGTSLAFERDPNSRGAVYRLQRKAAAV